MHLSPKESSELISPHVWLPRHQEKLQSISHCCLTCTRVNANSGQQSYVWYSTWWILGNGLHWSQASTVRLQILLLDFVNIVTGWVQNFPSRMKRAQLVAKKLIMEIIPRFGLHISLGSDNSLIVKLQVVLYYAYTVLLCLWLPCHYKTVCKLRTKLKN